MEIIIKIKPAHDLVNPKYVLRDIEDAVGTRDGRTWNKERNSFDYYDVEDIRLVEER